MKYDNPTNRTTRDILEFLLRFTPSILAWRHNVLPIPVARDGAIVSFRPGSKSGLPDIQGIIPPNVLSNPRNYYGVPLWIEVKTGRDKLRPAQACLHATARSLRSIVLVVKDYNDFLQQWNNLNPSG